MSTSSWILAGALVVSVVAGCEKASAPPPDAPTSAPPETPSATTPVAETASAEAAMPEPPASSEPATAASAEPAPSAVASSTPAPSTAKHAAAHGTKDHAAEPPPGPPPTDAPTADDACQTKNFHYSQVANACKSGGRKAAKGVMKGVVGKAKAAGTDLRCTSCHEDMKDFHLKSNAIGDLKNWL
ncbi:MAG TPA: hypothetical protein VH062_11425 [Polyangiaceae bacterium]|jgi:hypothetical protein|nr:hypothetical protein [Polyangiaceae bacterium]